MQMRPQHIQGYSIGVVALVAVGGSLTFEPAGASDLSKEPQALVRMAQATEAKGKQRLDTWSSSVKAPEAKKKQAAADPPKPDADKDRGTPAGQMQPQVHANNGGITACFDTLARASSQAVDGEHQAFSFWDQKRPNDGTFRSIVSLRYPHAAAPRGASIIINSPVGGACEATTLQVMPTLRPCNAIQADLMKNGRAVANLAGLALIQLPEDLSYLLLPTAGDGCAIVAIRAIQSR
ncbi:hypothetical protein [Hyphomicrobium sp. CS1BSMeth3]|uniref:hypothetical protein n=1 Tax=Hyphomicrobium sp. CS1BSMeth3 TaxID=1892844 RepID=UPI0011603D5A|nr:hypothetical protein [Hyphomicrobium sp. CS1BSMeth3]